MPSELDVSIWHIPDNGAYVTRPLWGHQFWPDQKRTFPDVQERQVFAAYASRTYGITVTTNIKNIMGTGSVSQCIQLAVRFLFQPLTVYPFSMTIDTLLGTEQCLSRLSIPCDRAEQPLSCQPEIAVCQPMFLWVKNHPRFKQCDKHTNNYITIYYHPPTPPPHTHTQLWPIQVYWNQYPGRLTCSG